MTENELKIKALAYYKQEQAIPSFDDYIGFLRFVGGFEDYKKALKGYKELKKELCPLEEGTELN